MGSTPLIQDLSDRASTLVEDMNPLIKEYGRVSGRHDYSYMLYYDTIDSTGTKANLRGMDLESYRRRVRQFKCTVSDRLHQMTILGQKKDAEIYCVNGDRRSMNDSKHIFFAGKFVRRVMEDVLQTLLSGAASLVDIRLRVYLVSCSFAGSRAYRCDGDTEISGEQFWEHWSRVRGECTQFERHCPTDVSFLAVAGADLVQSLEMPRGIQWIEPTEGEVTSAIAGSSRRTRVRHGPVRYRPTN